MVAMVAPPRVRGSRRDGKDQCGEDELAHILTTSKDRN